MLYHNRQGFTLIELVVVMAIFLTIIMISATAFERIADRSSQQSKSVETQIEGIVGLELFRSDLEGAGFGLPWELNPGKQPPEPAIADPAINYQEVTVAATVPPAGIDPRIFNDAPNNAPRPVWSANTAFNNDGTVGSKYLVIKSALVADNSASGKWTTISYDKDGTRTRKDWGSNLNFANSDRVIIVKNSLQSTPPTRQLMTSPWQGTFAPYSSPSTHSNGDTFEIYGVDPNTSLGMPFNRADYYVARPATGMPQKCANSPNVGILYKAIATQGGGLTQGMPLLDCVADMQVVYGVDASGSGIVDTDPNLHTTDLTGYTPEKIRSDLKEIRVYILAQEGKRDRFYSYPSTTIDVGERFGGVMQGRAFDLTRITDYQSYRWKVYTIVIRPKNVIQ